MTIIDELQGVVDQLVTDHVIFQDNAFLYKNRLELLNGGVSDVYQNLLYVRLDSDNDEFQFLPDEQRGTEVGAECILVAQLEKSIDINNALDALLISLFRIGQVTVTSATIDQDKISRDEYDQEWQKDLKLIKIKFNYTTYRYYDLSTPCIEIC